MVQKHENTALYALHPGGRMRKLRLRNAVSDTPFKKVAAMLIFRSLYSARNNSLPLFSWASGGPQPLNYWKASVSAGPQEASTTGLWASKRFSEASGGPPSQNEWKTNASAGPPEGLSCRTIGKQTVFAHAEAWSRWASRGPQPQKYWKTNSLRGC